MAPRMTRLKQALLGLWTGLNGGLRRALRRGRAEEPQESHEAIADRQEYGESDMSEHDKIDPEAVNHPEIPADSDEGLEAALASMQGELDSLTDVLTNDGSEPAAGSRPEEPASEAMDEADSETNESAGEETTLSEALAGAPDADDSPVADDAIDQASDVPMTDDATLRATMDGDKDAVSNSSNEAVESESAMTDAADEAVNTVSEPEPTLESNSPEVPASTMNEDLPNATRASAAAPVAQASARAGREANRGRLSLDDIEIPEPSHRSEHSARRRRVGSVQSDAVSGAILQLAAFLQDEVNELWDDARVALTEMLDYRDRMQQSTDRVEALEAEIRTLRDDLRQARQESRQLQTLMQNIRDDATRARQRADTAAMDAQSAADRAISAAREIESSASLSRGC